MTVTELQPRSRQVVAANVRARMGWLDMSPPDLARLLGCSVRTAYNKRAGITVFSPEDLDRLAKKFELATPAPLYEVPPGFPPTPQPETAENPVLSAPRRR